MIAGEKAAVDSKQKIRARYRGVDPSELEVIPALPQDSIYEDKLRRVAVYARARNPDDDRRAHHRRDLGGHLHRVRCVRLGAHQASVELNVSRVLYRLSAVDHADLSCDLPRSADRISALLKQ